MLLAGVYGMARVEQVRNVRFGGNARRSIERRTARVMFAVAQVADDLRLVVRRDVCARSLHLLTYLALLVVRYVERKLASFAQRVRRMRKPAKKEPYVSRLRMVARERHVRTEFDDENDA